LEGARLQMLNIQGCMFTNRECQLPLLPFSTVIRASNYFRNQRESHPRRKVARLVDCGRRPSGMVWVGAG